MVTAHAPDLMLQTGIRSRDAPHNCAPLRRPTDIPARGGDRLHLQEVRGAPQRQWLSTGNRIRLRHATAAQTTAQGHTGLVLGRTGLAGFLTLH